ncbi:amidohydrolase family protein [Sphingosinithalassobacter portus]|uniref:amidohydrolase family protein n=1 Tax=Stakelama portus TaxID=2676234 RepID=UPI000D6E485F|nr:amidohydrolase family protein [Sphingosinithalassobacter portus]
MADVVADEDTPRVDAHAHIFTRAMGFAEDAHSRPDYDYPVARYLADLDAHGISHGVIAAASLFGDNNDYTLAALDAHARLRGTVILRPETDAATLHAMADRGVVGVRLQWRRMAQFPDLSSDPYRAFLRRLADCGMHVELLAGGASLPDLLPRFADSGVRLVIDHFGVPSRDEAERRAGTDAVLRALQQGNAWVKISAGFRMPLPIAEECAARFLAEAGPERIIWGSDAPFVNWETKIDFADTIALYRRLVPDAETRRRIDATAMQLFFT